jgi:hypothetical protein
MQIFQGWACEINLKSLQSQFTEITKAFLLHLSNAFEHGKRLHQERTVLDLPEKVL